MPKIYLSNTAHKREVAGCSPLRARVKAGDTEMISLYRKINKPMGYDDGVELRPLE